MTKVISIQGILLPVDWNLSGDPVRLKLATFDEKDYHLRLDKAQVEALIPLLREEVVLELGSVKELGRKIFEADLTKFIGTATELEVNLKKQGE